MRYDVYSFKKKEIVIFLLEYGLLDIVISFLFYDSVWIFLFLLPGYFLYLKYKKKLLIEMRYEEVKIQFIQMISSFATALSAGFSPENALREAKTDIDRMFEDSYLSRELMQMINKINLGRRIESVFFDFAERTGITEIRDFALIFTIAKKNGSGFVSSIVRCVNLMSDSKDTEREIEVLLSGKQFEQKILTSIPIVLLAYLRYFSADFISILYHNAFGIMIMTACLGIYVASIYLARKITTIVC